eukprot:1755716-Rhodomonas_salina.3
MSGTELAYAAGIRYPYGGSIRYSASGTEVGYGGSSAEGVRRSALSLSRQVSGVRGRGHVLSLACVSG